MQIAASSMLIATTFASFSAAFHCEPGKPGHPSKDASAPDVVSREAGSDATGCANLVVEDPAISLDGYVRFTPDQKRNNPNAGEPSYVYIVAGSEAVVIPGPDVPSAPGLFVLKNPSIAVVGQRDTSADGYLVVVNDQLSYRVSISDFESEVALARVELCEVNHAIESRLVFRGNPEASGVAFDITVTAAVGSTLSPPTTPVTVEVR